jgi:hypothetical protein
VTKPDSFRGELITWITMLEKALDVMNFTYEQTLLLYIILEVDHQLKMRPSDKYQ